MGGEIMKDLISYRVSNRNVYEYLGYFELDEPTPLAE